LKSQLPDQVEIEVLTPAPVVVELSADDAKLVMLARGAKGRAGAAQGAAVRDGDGRTYAGATVELASLQLTALQAAVAIAVASGARELELAVVVGGTVDNASQNVARDLSTPFLVLTDDAGTPLQRITL